MNFDNTKQESRWDDGAKSDSTGFASRVADRQHRSMKYMITKTNNAKRRLFDDVFFKTQTSAKLDRIEDKLDSLIADAQPKDVYTTEAAGRLLKRKKETIRRLCREGRLLAQRAGGGRGGIEEWRITHAEIERYRKEGPRMSAGCSDA